MILKSDDNLEPKLWDKSIVKKIENDNDDKKICYLIWDPDPNQIIEQLKFAKKECAEIILSEILPDELPCSVLNDEFLFFCKTFKFLPSQFNIQNKEDKNVSKSKFIFIRHNVYNSKENEGNRNFVYHKYLTKTDGIEIIESEKIDVIRDFLLENISYCKKIIIDSTNPQLNHFAVIQSILSKVSCTIINTNSLGNCRTIGSGLELNKLPRENCGSLRSRFQKIIKEKEYSYKPIKKTFDTYIEYCTNKGISETQNLSYIIFQSIYNFNIDDDLWKNLFLKDNLDRFNHLTIRNGRFHRYFIFAIAYYYEQREEKQIEDNLVLNTLSPVFEQALFEKQNTHVQRLLCAIIRNLPTLLNLLEQIALNIYQRDSSKKNILSYIAECIVKESNATSQTNKDYLINTATKFVNKDYELGRCSVNSRFFFYHDIFATSNKYEELEGIILKISSENNFNKQYIHIFKLIPSFFDFDLIIKILNDKNLISHNNNLSTQIADVLFEGILFKYGIDSTDFIFFPKKKIITIYSEMQNDLLSFDYNNVPNHIKLIAGDHQFFDKENQIFSLLTSSEIPFEFKFIAYLKNIYKFDISRINRNYENSVFIFMYELMYKSMELSSKHHPKSIQSLNTSDIEVEESSLFNYIDDFPHDWHLVYIYIASQIISRDKFQRFNRHFQEHSPLASIADKFLSTLI